MRFIWKQLEYALYAFEHGTRLPDAYDVVKAINENNIELAEAIIETYELIHPKNVKPE